MFNFQISEQSRLDMEAVDFQNKSPMAKDMIEFWADACKMRDALVKADEDTAVDKGIKKFKKEFSPRLKQIIEEHAGFEVTKVVLSDKPNGMIAVEQTLINQRATIEATMRYSGQTPIDKELLDTYTKGDPPKYEDLEKVSASLDKEKSKWETPKGLKFKKDEGISAVLYLDLFVMLFQHEYLHTSLKRFTPVELAAIEIHEVGHMMSLIEHCADRFHRYSTQIEVERKFLESSNLSERIKLLSKKNKEAAAVNKASPNMASELVTNTASAADKMLTVLQGITQNKLATGAIFLLQVMIASLLLVICLALSVFKFSFNLFNGLNIEDLGWNQKLSDIARSAKQNSTTERLADEFASRHGLGGGVTTGLIKLDHTFEYLIFPAHFATMRQCRAYSHLCRFWATFIKGLNPEDEKYSVYEDSVNRVKRMSQNIIQLFQSINAPDEMIADYIRQFEEAEMALKEQKKRTKGRGPGRVYKASMKLLNNITDGQNLVDQIGRAGFRRKYAALSDAVEEIKNSRLYYNAVKLDQITKEKDK